MNLPFIPGNTFNDPTKTAFHKTQTLAYKNGYAMPTLPSLRLTDEELDELYNHDISLTYGKTTQAPTDDFVPVHVAFDKKVLLFNAYFKQTVHESDDEFYRVRPVKIFYYLEDDTISVVEPVVENSGIPQGTLIKRQRIPKNDLGEWWHWKDFNIGDEFEFYAKSFKIYDCNRSTREYLESEGLVINPEEGLPLDSYVELRKEELPQMTYKTPSDFDKLRQFVEMDRQVLRFYCIWDDRDAMFGETIPCVIHYYLVDDTTEIREVPRKNSSRDPFPVLIGRQKMPIDRSNIPSSFPTICLELSEKEINQWFKPEHFNLGETVYIRNRRFLLYDCDKFTKDYYKAQFNIEQVPVDVSKTMPIKLKEIPPYNGFGAVEDSLQSCLSLVPSPPQKDFYKLLGNNNKILRYDVSLETMRAEDKNRRFIMSYRLADDMITIYERQQRNSGVIGGKFLSRTRPCKPESLVDSPVFYTPADFSIGAKIEIFRHRFIIRDADEYVLKYLQACPANIPLATINSIRVKHGKEAFADESMLQAEQAASSGEYDFVGTT